MSDILKNNRGVAYYLSNGGNETKLFAVMLEYLSSIDPESKDVLKNGHYKEALNYCMQYLSFRIKRKETGNLIYDDIVNGLVPEQEAAEDLLNALDTCIFDHTLENLSRKGLIEVDSVNGTVHLTDFGSQIAEGIEDE